MSTISLSLIALQGVASLFLFLVCAALFAYRRRPYLLYWGLAWFCFSLWLLLDGINSTWTQLGLGWPRLQPLVQSVALLCGGWHAALWVFGLRRFCQGRTPTHGEAVLPAQSERIGPISLTGLEALILAGIIGAAVAASRTLLWSHLVVGMAGTRMAVYAWSVIAFSRIHRHPGLSGSRLLAISLAIYAAVQLRDMVIDSARAWHAVPISGPLDFLGVADFILPLLTAVGVIVVFVSDEQSALRDTLGRLAESEDRFRLLFDHSGVGIALLTSEGRLLQANTALLRLLGYDHGELQGRRLGEMEYRDSSNSADSSSQHALEDPPDLYEREKRYVHKDGHAVWARVVRVPVRDTGGRLRYFVGVLMDVTKRRRAEEALAASELRYRLRFQGAFDGIHVWAETGAFLDANPAFCRMLGYTRDELLNLSAADVADDLQQMRQHFATVLQQGGDRLETRLRHKDGQWVDVELSSAAMRTDGRLLLYVISRDISDRKRAEEGLRQSEERHRIILETSLDGVIMIDRAGGIVEFNAAAESIFARRSAEVLSQDMAELLLPPDAGRYFRAGLESYSKTGRGSMFSRHFELEAQRANGESFPAELAVNPIQQGDRTYFVSFIRDITERRRAEDTLKEERDFSSQVLETADALIVVLDLTGRILRFNGKCSALSGYREEDVRGHLFWDFLLPARFVEPAKAVFANLVNEQVPRINENPWLTRTGEERMIAWRNTTVKDARGQLRYVIGTGIDITDQRRLEEQLRHAQKMETLGTLVGGIAHDFNNQLTPILGNISFVRLQMTPEEPGYGELADAESAAQRCADLVRGLLTFSRQQVAVTQRININDQVAEAVRLLQRVLPPAIQLEVRTVPSLGMVNADRTQLHQVLMNLAVNARDAMRHGGVLILETANEVLTEEDCIRNVEARPGKFVVLRVQDTGTGMTPEVQARIFEPFYTTKEVGRGTGLGLAIVFGIVKAHHGWIGVASELGKGTTFEIYLPVAEKPAVDLPREELPVVRGGHECILVVDDEDMIRHLAQSVLEHWGFRVLTACDGEEVLGVYREHTAEIDLVLLDYSMPGMTGLHILEALQQINPAVRAIFASGYTVEDDVDHVSSAGAKAFLRKPYRPEELVRTVRQVLDGAESLVQN